MALLTQEGQEDGMVESLEDIAEGESGTPSVDEILLLVDATNGFNMLSRLSMLCDSACCGPFGIAAQKLPASLSTATGTRSVSSAGDVESRRW